MHNDFTLLMPAYPGCPGIWTIKQVFVCQVFLFLWASKTSLIVHIHKITLQMTKSSIKYYGKESTTMQEPYEGISTEWVEKRPTRYHHRKRQWYERQSNCYTARWISHRPRYHYYFYIFYFFGPTSTNPQAWKLLLLLLLLLFYPR